MSEFEATLLACLEHDPEIRGPAEEDLNNLAKDPQACIEEYLNILADDNADPVARDLGATMFRHSMDKNDQDSIYSSLSPKEANDVRQELMKIAMAASVQKFRVRIYDILFVMARNLVNTKGFPKMRDLLLDLAESEDHLEMEMALYVLGDLAQYITKQMSDHYERLNNIFTIGLEHENALVKVSALKCASEFLGDMETEDALMFQDLLGPMLDVLTLILEAEEEPTAREVLEVFIELAEEQVQFFFENANDFIDCMMNITDEFSFEDQTRFLACEFIISFAEAAPSVARAMESFGIELIGFAYQWIQHPEDEDEWDDYNGKSDPFSFSFYDLGAEVINRLTEILGYEATLKLNQRHINELLDGEDWHERHAGLLGFVCIAQHCKIPLMKQLKMLVKVIVPFLQDDHQRVRYQAITAVAQMASQFEGELQTNYADQIVPPILDLIADAEHPRVQALACKSIVNFVQYCTTEVLNEHVEDIAEHLIYTLDSDVRYVLEEAVTALATIADKLEGGFEKWYDDYVPYLKDIMRNADEPEYKGLRGRAIEAFSMIALVNTSEKFFDDAMDVLDILKDSLKHLEIGDNYSNLLLSGYARLCKAVGSEAFAPYLDAIMPIMLESAELEVNSRVLDDEEDDEEDYEGWEIVLYNNRRVGIHTAAMEEKATACQMLFFYANHFKVAFIGWAQAVYDILSREKMLTFLHEDVRAACYSTLPELFNVVLLAATTDVDFEGKPEPDDARDLFEDCLTTMASALLKEEDEEVVYVALESFTHLVAYAGEMFMEDSQLEHLSNIMLKMIEGCLNRRLEREETSMKDFTDETELELLMEQNEVEESIMSAIGEVIGAMIKTHSEVFFPIFDKYLLDTFDKMMSSDFEPYEQATTLCVFDDLMEFGGQVAESRYYNKFYPFLQECLLSEDPALRQAAVYGAGVCSRFVGDKFTDTVVDVAEALLEVLQDPEAKSPENQGPSDNACASLMHIIKNQGDEVDVQHIIEVALYHMPFEFDYQESKNSYPTMMDYLEDESSLVEQHLVQVLRFLAGSIQTRFNDEDMDVRMMKFLEDKIMNGFDENRLNEAFDQLEPEEQEKLQELIGG